jgi:hypothetical protein
MGSWQKALESGRRALPAAGLILLITIGVILLLLAPDLYRLLPPAARRRPIALVCGGLAAVYVVARLAARLRPAAHLQDGRLRFGAQPLDQLGSIALGGGLTVGIVAACLAMLAMWLPHYLLWPWGRDHDTFATLAQGWDAGVLPYRDVRAYNFPGTIYVFWILGKIAGWGRTWSFYAADASVLIALGATLMAWSRRCLARILPGALAYLVFLTFYLNRDFETAAQRDWHASVAVALALLVVQAWPGRRSRILSALLFALAVTIRPHVVLFLPALGLAAAESARGSRRGTQSQQGRSRAPAGRSPLHALGEWVLAAGLFTALSFAPLFIAGIAGDFLRGLKVVVPGGPYAHNDVRAMASVLGDELLDPAILIVLGLLALAWPISPVHSRRVVAAWTLALLMALLYRPLHPFPHYYLVYPTALFSSVALALPLSGIANLDRVPPLLRVAALLVLTSETISGLPYYCSISDSARAVCDLWRGQTLPATPPRGSLNWFNPVRAMWYSWNDYRRTLIHLKDSTGPATMVANVLKHPPFLGLNGPTGRLSPFRAESGICWMLMVDLDLDSEFARDLERATDSVVVWMPDESQIPPRLRLDQLNGVIRKHYRFDARFGRIEVWRRASEPREEQRSSGQTAAGTRSRTAARSRL